MAQDLLELPLADRVALRTRMFKRRAMHMLGRSSRTGCELLVLKHDSLCSFPLTAISSCTTTFSTWAWLPAWRLTPAASYMTMREKQRATEKRAEEKPCCGEEKGGGMWRNTKGRIAQGIRNLPHISLLLWIRMQYS